MSWVYSFSSVLSSLQSRFEEAQMLRESGEQLDHSVVTIELGDGHYLLLVLDAFFGEDVPVVVISARYRDVPGLDLVERIKGDVELSLEIAKGIYFDGRNSPCMHELPRLTGEYKGLHTILGTSHYFLSQKLEAAHSVMPIYHYKL